MTPPTGFDVTMALTDAATVAGRAPSIHNTQPWRLVVDGQALGVYAETARRLSEVDPAGHLMLLSCGAATHHAQVALAAAGWRTETDRPADPDAGPLARIRVVGRDEPDPVALRRFEAIGRRRTDRRAVPASPVPEASLAAVTAAVAEAGVHLHILGREQVVEVAVAVEKAMRAEGDDDAIRGELAGWAGGARAEGSGIPDTSIPAQAPRTTVAGRDFGVGGTLPPGAGHDESAVYAVLYGSGDMPVDWLRAGEALSAGWLDAVALGLTLLPFSAPVEIASTRRLLDRLISHIGHSYLVVRFGLAASDAPPRTPRLPAGQTVEVRS
jgi:nitroreductase